jgi:hypothetical protein
VVPQPAGVVGTGQPADHRAEERRVAGWLEVQDRRADVAPRQRQRLLSLRPDLVVERRVVKRFRQLGGQPGLAKQWLQRSCCPEIRRGQAVTWGVKSNRRAPTVS